MGQKIKISQSRICAYKVLNEVLVGSAYSNISLNKHLRGVKIEEDRSLCSNIVYGVIKKINMLDYIISKLSTTDINEMDVEAKMSLYIGLYQILYLDKIPEYALVNDSVNLVKFFGKRKLSGFVNGILRNALRKKKELKEISFNSFYDVMKYEYGFNEDLVDVLKYSYSEKEILEYGKYVLNPASVNLRVNTLKTSKEELKEKLLKEFIITEDSFIPDGLIVKSHINLNLTKSFKEGLFTVQDLAGMLVSYALNPEKNDNVLDMCSAPGGKTMHCASMMDNTGSVTACDIYDKKLDLIRFNAMSLGLSNIKVISKDATKHDESFDEKFDKVICDVPCSGLGVIRRKPEICLKFKEENIESLNKIQCEVLKNGIKYLKKGGTLIYSTCTINKKENEDIVNSVIKDMSDIEYANIDFPFDFNYNKEDSKNGILNIDGKTLGTDGFFICKLKKLG